MNFIAGVLQFVVAGYALRLNRLFGTSRVGWSLFAAFALLALLHLIQSVTPFGAGAMAGVEIGVTYSLISLLLLTGMVHMETLLQARLRLEQEEKQLRAGLESEVKKKTAYLMQAVEELQSEKAERQRMELEVKKTNTELFFASSQVKAAEMATTVLRNMASMLNSVNVSAGLVSDQMKQSKINNVVNIGALIREHAADLGRFMARDPRGQKLPQYIAELGDHLANERTILTRELESLKNNIEQIMALEQSYKKFTWHSDALAAAKLVAVPQVSREPEPREISVKSAPRDVDESQPSAEKAFLASYFKSPPLLNELG